MNGKMLFFDLLLCLWMVRCSSSTSRSSVNEWMQSYVSQVLESEASRIASRTFLLWCDTYIHWSICVHCVVSVSSDRCSNGCMHLEVGLHSTGHVRTEISHTRLRYIQLLLYELCSRQKWQPVDGPAWVMVRRPLPESSVDGFFQGDYYMGNCSTGSIMQCGQPSSSVNFWTGRERRHGTVRFSRASTVMER